MWNKRERDQFAEELFLAGQRVPAGLYGQVGGARVVRLDCEDRASHFRRARSLLRAKWVWTSLLLSTQGFACTAFSVYAWRMPP
jgi:hypothetical protein